MLDAKGLESVLEDIQLQQPEGVANLFTLTSFIEYISTGNSSIEKYKNADLGSFNVPLINQKPDSNY